MAKFIESEHPRNSDGKFTDSDFFDGEEKDTAKEDFFAEQQKQHNKKMTPAEKIASVHIDFDRDNILPELNESELKKVGAKKNKPILLKKGVIERNREEHSDLTDNDFEQIVVKALYSPSEVFSANKEKPYFHFAKVIEVNSKGKPEIGLALLDVDDKKDNFEVVHAHFMEVSRFNKMLSKKKD